MNVLEKQSTRRRIMGRRGFTALLVLVNALFWLIFAVWFVSESYPYEPHTKLFEEASSPYMICSRAFPFRRYLTPLMRTTRLLQWPSF